MLNTSRYILIFLTIVSLSILFPKLYWLIVDKPESHTIFFYSITEKEFVLSNRVDGKTEYQTASGKEISRKEYFQSLPLMYFRNLVTDGTMPDSIKGIKMDPHEINMTNLNVKLFPYNIDRPDYGLYPLFESNTGIDSPTLPDDFFRFSNYGLEFIDAKSNQIMEEKSRVFTEALQKHYFTFPPKIIAGNTSLRKSVDEGYFIVDALDHFFNLKMTNGKPEVTVIRLPRNFYIKHIECVEVRSGEFLAILVTRDNKLHLLMSAGYFTEELPITNYNPEVDLLRIHGDMFHKTIVISGPSYTKATTINTDYELVDTISESWTPIQKTAKGKWARTMFPVQLSATNSSVGFKHLQIIPPTLITFLVNLVFVLLYLYIQKNSNNKKGIKPAIGTTDSILILMFGIFAFIACNLIKQNQN